jgi:hypothetical protein
MVKTRYASLRPNGPPGVNFALRVVKLAMLHFPAGLALHSQSPLGLRMLHSAHILCFCLSQKHNMGLRFAHPIPLG